MELTKVLERLAGDRELLQEIIEIYFEETPELMEEITSAAEMQDHNGLEVTAHTLKGALANFCDSQAVSAAKALEAAARERDLSRSADQVARLKREVARLSAELAAIRQN